MKLEEFSNAVKEIIRGEPREKTLEFVKELSIGVTRKAFGFMLIGKTVKVLSPFRSIPTAVKHMLRISHSSDYDYSIRVQSDGKAKVISKRFASNVDVDAAKKQLFFGQDIERVFYEIVTTEDFEVTFSEYEGTIIKASNDDLARRYFQGMMSLFPFVETGKDTNNVKVICEFDIQPWDAYKKEQQHKGSLSCRIEIDGKGVGTKGNNFVF